jgi:hypothetical protein
MTTRTIIWLLAGITVFFGILACCSDRYKHHQEYRCIDFVDNEQFNCSETYEK